MRARTAAQTRRVLVERMGDVEREGTRFVCEAHIPVLKQGYILAERLSV